jgi:3-phenylpropionate/cinnamic acid dioxygenase small subunit
MDDATRTSDELAIRNLITELMWQADNASIDELDPYIACFTEDAEWEMFGDVRRGHAAIRAGAEDRRRSGMMGPGTNVMHFLGCTTVAFDGPDAAEVKSYIQAYRDTAENPTIFLMGQYHDEVVRTDGGWKLARRVVKFG